MSLPWFRTYTRLIDDEKLKLLAFEDRWHFMAILCCKGQGILDNPGELMRRKVAVKLGLAVRELDEVVRRLSEVGLIDADTLQPLAWDKLQFVSDSDPTRNERQARYRERVKRTGNALPNGPVARTDTDSYPDPEIQRSRDPEEDSEKEGKRKEVAARKTRRQTKEDFAPSVGKTRQVIDHDNGHEEPRNGHAVVKVNGGTAVQAEATINGHINGKTIGSRAWEAYAMAYFERYGTEPVRNARTNAQLAQLAKRLPADEICEVVCWYVRSSNAFYVRDSHGLGLLLRDCEGLRTQWATNSRMTSTEARQMDEHESTYESVRWVRANMDRLRKLRAEGKI
jgi:hypothetical protein